MGGIGWLFLAAAVTLVFAFAADLAMTRCQANSFASVVGFCTARPK